MKRLMILLILLPVITQAQGNGPAFIFPGRGGSSTSGVSWLANPPAGTPFTLHLGDTTLFKISNYAIFPTITLKGPNYTTTLGGNSSTFSTYILLLASGSNGNVQLKSNTNTLGLLATSNGLTLGTSSPVVTNWLVVGASSWFSNGIAAATRYDIYGKSAIATPGIRADTIIAPMRVIDTTTWVASDSSYWRVTEKHLSKTPSVNLGYKFGEITMEVEFSSGGNFYFDLATDSTNLVRISTIHAELSSESYNASPAVGVSSTSAVGSAGAAGAGYFFTTAGSLGSAGRHATYFYWSLYTVNNITYTYKTGKLKLKIRYSMPSANTSSNPIILLNG